MKLVTVKMETRVLNYSLVSAPSNKCLRESHFLRKYKPNENREENM